MHKEICEICKNEFDCFPSRNRKFCSKKCSAQRPNKGRFQLGHKWDEETEQKRKLLAKQNYKCGMLGKKHTEETKKRMSESSKNPYNYIDGGYRGKINNSKCSICGENEKRIVIHHKDGNRQNNNIKNLQAVCDKCHSKIHFPDGLLGKNAR